MNRSDANYARIKSAMQELLNNSNARFDENAKTATLHFCINHNGDLLEIYHIWGNNPILILYKDDLKIVSSDIQDVCAALTAIIDKWQKTKTL